ncbi:hypothetical protein M0765_012760 [Variovorax sp. S2]|uniref:hypothetical protein n=1 Tax=Variovorax sp. S12S4 TaxID=3029170 RepID=UPI00215C9F8E|nr:hypothetical protein [Variovorax sp. S12S4]MCR8958564.1 hypothetical protein [Variovorax sp. S12S4]
MTVLQLKKALSSVDWNAGVLNFSNDANTMEKFDKGCARIAEWVRGLASADAGNPALAFLWSAQTAANTAVVSSSLSLYHAAAASIRNVVENGLYYSYFRSHPAELATLVRDKSFYISKADVIAFYRLHIPEFKSIQEKLGLQSRLENWYSDISAIVHGQLPGVWVHHVAIKDINPNQATQGRC